MDDSATSKPTARAVAKAETRDRILTAAREQLAVGGAESISMRRIAETVGVVPSALYKHVPTKDALLTELIIDSYQRLAAAISDSGSAWHDRTQALRDWALRHPHEFYLIYGTPVRGYKAPADTIAPAAAVFECFVTAVDAPFPLPNSPERRTQLPTQVRKQLFPVAADTGCSEEMLAHILSALSRLVGIILLELGGHFVGTVSPTDEFYTWAATSGA